MRKVGLVSLSLLTLLAATLVQPAGLFAQPGSDGQVEIGREVAVSRHLEDNEEFKIPLLDLIEHGKKLFKANWTLQEGAGRPFTKGVGKPLSDPDDPLTFPRNFNRISAPDANSCAGCHNAPFGIAGGGGDFVTSVFVLGQRFDFVTFDLNDPTQTGGSRDEAGRLVTPQTVANRRATLGMFGSGYIEMLARQMTDDLQALRDATPTEGKKVLITKGISFGTLVRDEAGNWETSGIEGLPAPSLISSGPDDPPSLIIRPFHQAGAAVSLREFTNNAFNHHHGIQSTERFGKDTDPDGDLFVNELTRADMTASAVFQATLPVPGRVIPNDPGIEEAVRLGEKKFVEIGCGGCHVPNLVLDNEGWVFTEPNPYNPDGSLQPGDAPALSVDLTDKQLPQPRLEAQGDVVHVAAFTDLKLHDVTSIAEDCSPVPGLEPLPERLDMNQPAGTPGFFAGNGKFLTKRLWGAANEPPYFHHGQFTTLREAVLAHNGEACGTREAFQALSNYERNAIIEFLKTLQVLPPGTPHLVVDEKGNEKDWPGPNSGTIIGKAFLQRGSAHQGIALSVSSDSTTTARDGGFSITNVSPGTYSVRAHKDGYLAAEQTGIEVVPGGVTTLPDVALKGGDCDGDEIIDIFDLAMVGACYGTTPLSDPRADVDGDGTCSLFDLVMVGGNYGLRGPTEWSAPQATTTSGPPDRAGAVVELTPATQ